ncbi:hypothetical protein [Ruminococcus flavefaciens]|uniref:hypothetical protein n=1 Tax=Ruminococcus flavefaciens TaxID=1265 RepID=UPI0026EB166F|nr:hypothetical protein [Ruminococcus flavefaciens]
MINTEMGLPLLLCCLLLLIMMIVGLCMLCVSKKLSVRITGIVLLALVVICIGYVVLFFAAVILQFISELIIEGVLESCFNEIQTCGRIG